MKSAMQLKKEMVVVWWLVIVGILVGATALAQDTMVPGFDLPIRWGMSPQELEKALAGLDPYIPSGKTGRGGEYGDSQWIVAMADSGQYDGRKCSLNFYMDQSDKLVAFTCALGKMRALDWLSLKREYDEKYQDLKSELAEDEDVHMTWKAGNTIIELEMWKFAPDKLIILGKPVEQ